MARQSTPTKPKSRTTTRKRTPRKKKTKPFLAFIANIPAKIKRLILQLFIGISVVSATFPAITQGVSDWIGSQVDPNQVQSLLAIPILGDILKRSSLVEGGGYEGSVRAPKAKT